jgi:hypothetical protein
MSNWFESDVPPPLCQGNPGNEVELEIGFSNSENNWTERVNLVSCLADVLKLSGYIFEQYNSHLKLQSGFLLQPRFVTFQLLDNGDFRTVTTINIHHEKLITQGIFEYQHSAESGLERAIVKGLQNWIDTDLVVLIDAKEQELKNSTLLTIRFPEEETKEAFERRVVLGFPMHYYVDRSIDIEEEHPFCPCCLFTNSYQAFAEQIETTDFYAIRFFVMRDEAGEINADCRVNGEDWEVGKQALIEYGKTWNDRGFEFRKQYIVIQTLMNA